MNEKKNIEKVYLTRDYLSHWVWIRPRVEIRRNFVRVKGFGTVNWEWIEEEIKHPGRWVLVKNYRAPIYCLDNNWTYYPVWRNSAGWGTRQTYTMPEIRRNQSDRDDFYEEGYKIKLRGKRFDLPDDRAELRDPHVGRNWKRTHKVRKQWMKNI